MNRAELKAQARAQIQGKIGILFIITLIISAMSAAASFALAFIPFGSLVGSIIITPAFTLSLVRVFLLVVRGGQPEVSQAFCGFKDFFGAFKVTFLTGLYTFLWSLLFIIPGIVKGFAYSMSVYVFADNPNMRARDCIAESVKMTNGHKAELFVLELSFLGWMLLGMVTLGIAYIWVYPYMCATMTNAYESLKPVVEVPSANAEVTAAEPVAEENQ